MKTIVISLAVVLATFGCASISNHNSKTSQDIKAGKEAAEKGRAAALSALEAVKGIKPSK